MKFEFRCKHGIFSEPCQKCRKPETLMDYIKAELNMMQMNRDDQGHWLRAEQLLEKIRKAGL